MHGSNVSDLVLRSSDSFVLHFLTENLTPEVMEQVMEFIRQGSSENKNISDTSFETNSIVKHQPAYNFVSSLTDSSGLGLSTSTNEQQNRTI